MKVPKLGSVIRIPLLYILLGSAWIILTDGLTKRLIPPTSNLYIEIQTAKGWIFVLASAVLFYVLLRAEENWHSRLERQYRQLFNSSPDAIFIVDGSGRFVEANQMAIERYGFSDEELLSMTVSDLAAGELSDEAMNQLRSSFALAGNAYQWCHRRKAKPPLEVEIRARPVEWGGQTCMMHTVVDNTARQSLQRALNERNTLLERLNLILERSPIACIMHDRDYHIKFWNPAARQIFGYDEEEVLGHTPFELIIPPEVHDYVKTILADLAVGTTSVQAINANMTKDGRQVICEWLNTPLVNSDGDFIGYLAMAQDVTERTRVMEVLQESEQRFRRLVDSNIIGVVIYKTDGTIIEANEAFLRMTGFTKSDYPLNWFALTPLEWQAVEEQVLDEINTLGVAQPLEKEIRHKNGRSIPVLVGAARLDEPAQVITFVLDLSETKRKEAQIRASLAEKEVLLREVHHRVKNNLEVIISLAELQTIKISDPAVMASIRELQERIRSIALVHENLYRSENLEQIQVQTYLEKVVHFLIISFAPSGSDVNVDADDIVMNIEQAIPCGLIVNELVTNAFKHAFPHGTQHLNQPEARRIKIRLEQDEQNYRLTVSDNGIGLPADLDPQQATTLGLRLVNLLSLQLHGQMQAETAAGARFRITFPRPG
jgi:PAS domain S-box-containing protein